MDERITFVARAVRALQRADRTHQVFGASTHRYQVAPPLSEDALASIERERGVRFPTELRTYLTTYSSGGVGPYYGLVPLTEADAMLVDHMGAEALGAWGAPFSGAAEVERYDGCVFASMQGCGHFSVIVLDGPHAGEVWSEGEGGGQLAVESRSFLDWMRDWAERALVDWAIGAIPRAFDAGRSAIVAEDAFALAKDALSRASEAKEADAARALGLGLALANDLEGAERLLALAASSETQEPAARAALDRARIAKARGRWVDVESHAREALGVAGIWASTKHLARCVLVEALERTGQD